MSLSNIIKSPKANANDHEGKPIRLSNVVLEESVSEGDSQSDSSALKNAEREAEAILENARNEAEQIYREAEKDREKAEEKIEQACQEAKEKGRSDGYQVGLDEGEKQYKNHIEEARLALDNAKNVRQEHLDKSEHEILELGIKIAEKILSTTLSEQTDRWLQVIKNMISEVKEYDEVRLTVHVKWYPYMVAHQQELASLLKKTSELYIYPETSDDEFLCLIEYPYGQIDASVDRQLSEIKQKLAAKLEESTDEHKNFA